VPFPLVGVDAFTGEPFRGNPAAVCLLDGPADESWMQALASEMNLSETAFVEPREDGFGLRWFTPTTEVQLCGHATLASAHVLWELGRLSEDQPAVFHTRWKGTLRATRAAGRIALDFPAAPTSPITPPDGLAEALGVTIVDIAASELHHVVELADATVVRDASPDFAALRAVEVEGVAITAAGDEPDVDYVNRYFAPRWGIDEDPVTGSAHTSLGPYWAAKLSKSALRARQVSRRGGEIEVELHGDRVALLGEAVTVWRGEVG
jgi:PhzF family phenazine biosynthesis protein